MSYSKKLENYITTEEIARIYERHVLGDCDERVREVVWQRVMAKYPKASSTQWDKIYTDLTTQFLMDYEVEVTVAVKKGDKNGTTNHATKI